jgi:hypothetical protein
MRKDCNIDLTDFLWCPAFILQYASMLRYTKLDWVVTVFFSIKLFIKVNIISISATWKLFFKFWILCLYRIVNFQCRGYWNWQKLKNLLQQVKDRNYLDVHSVSFERTWRKLVQKRTVRTRLEIHVFRRDCLDLCEKNNLYSDLFYYENKV